MHNLKPLFESAKTAAQSLALVTDTVRDDILRDIAATITRRESDILAANKADLARMDPADPLYDRLLLTPKRLADIARDMLNVASLPSPLNRILDDRTLPNGLHLRKITVPFGVIGVIYEARPNVTFDVFSLCFKSGSACILKGGSNAHESNTAIAQLIRDVLAAHDICTATLTLLPPTHEAAETLLHADAFVDLCIPRGGKRLIRFVRDNARVPVIETGAGVVHTYFDKDGDITIGARIVCNAKTRRVSVCNALDCLLLHKDRLDDLPALVAPLIDSQVRINGDAPSLAALSGAYPDALLKPIAEGTADEVYSTEYMDYEMSLKTVDSLDDAVKHIARYGSGHSESIITASPDTAAAFQQRVDAACVYWNAPTSFTDGAQFGLGAEIGISTQKLGARGPMGPREITTYKWLIDGNGQTRP